MAFDIFLAERVSLFLTSKHISFEEKKMMGGLTFMVKEKMCVGIHKDKLMVRIDPEIYEKSLLKKGCIKIEFTGREMKGFVFIEPLGIDKEKDLEYWINLALEFNKKAKATKWKRC